MKRIFRQFFALDVHPDQLPTNHGATLVANTAFATVGVIGLIVLVPTLIWGEHIVVALASLLGIVGAINGYLLWKRGHVVLSTTLHAGGLVLAGGFAFLGTQTIGGATGILFLASVITAGGFVGWKGAVIDVAVVFAVGVVILLFGDQLRPMIGLTGEPFQPPEHLVQLFVFFSIPAWGAYVVAVDTSNRQAWKAAVENKQRLEKVNHQLQQSQQQQAKIAELGLMALQDVSLEEIERMCRTVFVEVIPNAEYFWPKGAVLTDDEVQSLSLDVDIEYSLFVDGLVQIVSTRRIREKLIAERARLASELQKEQRLESLSRMAGGVAHDFNNALMVVTGIGDDLLTTSTLDDKAQKGVKTILSVSRHISDMTTQLLLFAKGLPIKASVVDVNGIVQNMEPVLRQVVPSGVKLSTKLSSTLALVKLSPEQIERMVLNLVRNSSMAFDATANGEVEVSVFVDAVNHNALKSGPTVCIQVRDNGMGMDEETRERAIEPYFSIRGSTGLGLSTVHGLIEQAGGLVEIFSTVGEGTTVKLWVPARVQEEDSSVLPMENVSLKGTVLLIDDEPMVRKSVKVLLRNLGWQVLEASGRGEATSLLKHSVSIDLVVCDVRLGTELGFALITHLYTLGLQAPVLYITGFATHSTTHLAHNERLLVKPFLTQDLDQAIEKLLQSV